MSEVAGTTYAARVTEERERYAACENVHDLPPIFHYWSEKYVRPKLERFGFSGAQEFFGNALRRACEASGGPKHFVSIGSGNCDVEVAVVRSLLDAGVRDFEFHCVDINPLMLGRGRQAAQVAGVGEVLRFIEADVNDWRPKGQYDAVIANQSLHHIANLEGVFGAVKSHLRPRGRFVISDIIGRNGHQRWPEALAVVHEIWRRLPPPYRHNRQLGRYEELYENWDCSTYGFEGVRAQDILPLLLKDFQFEQFIAYANIIDVFVDRGFGPNFNAESAWDRAFIDEVHHRDEIDLNAGRVTPTHMWAVLAVDEAVETRYLAPLSPEFCVRNPNRLAPPDVIDAAPFEWASWPHSAQDELAKAYQCLAEAERRVKQKAKEADDWKDWAQSLDRELKRRTEWAQPLDRELKERTEWAQSLDQQLRERTEWARSLARELKERTEQAQVLDRELKGRTDWAQSLDRELKVRTDWARSLDRELKVRTEWAESLDREMKVRTEWAKRLSLELSALQATPEARVGRIVRWILRKLIGRK